MALRFFDGADHYAAGQVTNKWTTVVNGAGINTGRRAGSSAVKALSNGGTGAAGVLTKNLTAKGTWIVGGAFNVVNHGGSTSLAGTAMPVRLIDNTTTQVDIRINSDGSFTATRNGTTLASSAAGLITVDTWWHLECKVIIASSGGRVILKINGNTVIDFTGNTQATGNATADKFAFQSGGGSTQRALAVDDLYLLDGDGPGNNDFLGDLRVDTLYPTAEGAHSDFTPLSGTDNALMVDEAGSVDDDTTYVVSGTNNHIDTYVTQNLPGATLQVLAVNVWVDSRREDVGTREIANVIRSGSTDYVGTPVIVQAAYTMQGETYLQDPDTGSTWTVSGVNAAEFGQKLIS